MNSRHSVIPSDSERNIREMLLSWQCLKEIGYVFSHVEHWTLSEGIEVEGFLFENLRANIMIEYTYYRSLGMGDVIIRNTKIKRNRSFGVEDWLKSHQGELAEGLTLKAYQRIIYSKDNSNFENLLAFLEKLFLGPLKSLLLGEAWEQIPWLDKYK